jgi:ABC-2 type transport system ATP-binding protein
MMRRRLGELSRGYKQRVGLAEVLLHNPPVLVLDEPTTGLDPAQIRAMREVIRGLAEQHTVILSSHILAEVEQTCNYLVFIAGGRIAATGKPAEIRQRVTGPSKIIAEVRGQEPSVMAGAVKAVAGVKDVEASDAGNWTRLVIQGDPNNDLRAQVYQAISQKGWQMRELRREVGSLEDFFVQITYEQNVGGAQRAAV